MPLGTRYTRVDPAAGSPAEQNPYSPHPMQFSNDFRNPHSQNLHWREQTSASYLVNPARSQKSSPGTSNDLPTYDAYRDEAAQAERPGKPKLRRTTNSFVSSLSSVWGASRDFAVSHFAVPKLAAPWEHEISEKGPWDGQTSNTIREFDHRRQRRRLFVNSSFQLMITAGLCAALAGALYGFSTIYWGLSQAEKKGFNALITGLSIILGLNLASSLKGYAQMMRWRFLASGYRTLQDFELVMQCESQSKVFRLLWAGRTRGQILPNRTQILAFLWLTINIALQIVVALLGLTYSLDISDNYVSTRTGNITVADLSAFYVSTSTDYSVSSQGAIAQNFGVTGQDYPNTTSYVGEYVGGQEQYFQNAAMTKYWYNFVDQSPDGKETILSTRSIITNATCTSYKVVKGGYSGFDNPANITNDVTWVDSTGENITWNIQPTSTGGTTWMVRVNSTDSHCGPRCTRVYALQAADNVTVLHPRFWECKNQVSHVTNVAPYGSASIFDMPDVQASIMAGAIGYSGINVGPYTDGSYMQFRAYPINTLWSPTGSVSELDMARLLMEFTTGAMAALDFNGGRVTAQRQAQPIPAQIVNVTWEWTCIVLGVIPLTQALVLVLVVGWANKAVIKDTSFLATARLLRPIVDKLGDRGCLLTGDEIAEELGNYRVIYGPRFPGGSVMGGEDAAVKHLDILAEDEGLELWRGRMPAGRYDGTTTWGRGDVRDEEEVEGLMEGRARRVRRRMSL